MSAVATRPATVRAAVYARISQDTEGKSLGVQRQAKECRELARRRGWSVVDVYEDNDLSAYSGKSRPAYLRLLEDIRAGAVNAVIAWHPDRLHRSTRELLDFADLARETSCTVETVQSGDMNLFSASGKAVAVTLSAWSRYESEQKSERLKAKHRELAAAGRDSGGGRAFGYEEDRMSIRLDEAVVVREAAERVLAGESIRSICRDWTARGIKSVKGGAWNPHVVRRMLTAARISGRRDVGTDADGKRPLIGRDPVKAVWPAIITVEQSDRLRALLSDPGRRQGTHRATHLLTGGLARCGRCGAALVSRPKQNDRAGAVVDGKLVGAPIPALTCAHGPGYKGCGHLGILYEPLEQLVVETVLAAIDTGALAKAMRGHDDKKAIAELAKVEEKRDELARDWAADRLSRKEWQAAREPLEARQKELQRQVDSGRRSVQLDGIDAKTLRTMWTHLPLHRQKAVVGALVEAVIIGPGRRGFNQFDYSRVSIKWKA